MEDGVGVLAAGIQDGDRLFGRHTQELHLATLGLQKDFVHHWQSALGSGPDHQPAAVPRASSLIERGVCP